MGYLLGCCKFSLQGVDPDKSSIQQILLVSWHGRRFDTENTHSIFHLSHAFHEGQELCAGNDRGRQLVCIWVAFNHCINTVDGTWIEVGISELLGHCSCQSDHGHNAHNQGHDTSEDLSAKTVRSLVSIMYGETIRCCKVQKSYYILFWSRKDG